MNIDNALKYAGIPVQDQRSKIKAAAILETMAVRFPMKIAWKVFPLIKTEAGYEPEQTGMVLSGKTASHFLQDAQAVLIGAATLGMTAEREACRLQAINMEEALLFDGCGSAWIEESLDQFEASLPELLPGWHFSRRFSCGYGDLPLALQSDIDRILQMSRNPGIFLQKSLMMVPSKSVTFFIGLSKHPLQPRQSGCAICSMQNSCQDKSDS